MEETQMSAGSTTRQLVVFSLGEEEYALPIAQVHEIIRYTEPRSVASASAWVRGVINLRGKIVPVYDLGARLGQVAESGKESNIVIVEAAGSVAGVVVDDVDQVLTVDEEQLESVPSSGSDAIESIAKLDDRLIILLQPEGIFGGEVVEVS
jgi:purine-binding chemotaxis protein CheW